MDGNRGDSGKNLDGGGAEELRGKCRENRRDNCAIIAWKKTSCFHRVLRIKTHRLFSRKFHAILTPVFTALSTSLFSTISIKAFTIARTTAVHERGCPQHLRPQKHSCNSSAPVFHPRPKPPSTCQLKPKSTPVSCSKANPYLHPPAQTRGAPSLPPQTKTSHLPAS